MISQSRFTLPVTALALLSTWLFFSGLMVAERAGLLEETSQQDERALASLEQALPPESVASVTDHQSEGEAVIVTLAPQTSFQSSLNPSTRSDLSSIGWRSRHLYQVFSVYRI